MSLCFCWIWTVKSVSNFQFSIRQNYHFIFEKLEASNLWSTNILNTHVNISVSLLNKFRYFRPGSFGIYTLLSTYLHAWSIFITLHNSNCSKFWNVKTFSSAKRDKSKWKTNIMVSHKEVLKISGETEKKL